MAVDHLLTSTHHSTMFSVGSVSSQALPRDFLATAPLILVAVTVWVLEQKRRGAVMTLPGAAACGRMLRQVAPECLGLAVCIGIAGSLVKCRVNLGASLEAGGDKEIWAEINSDWPLLQTADTLIGFQSMLRLVLLASLAARASIHGPMAAFVGTPAALLLLAAAARVALLALSPRDVYHLDGPLGGWMHAVLEVAALPPLMYLSCVGTNLKHIGCAAVTGTLLAASLAVHHHLKLADPGQVYLDMLFSMDYFFGLFAALALLFATIFRAAGEEETAVRQSSSCSSVVAARFAHILLPLMQALPAYFMIAAWGGEPFAPLPELVGSGRPFELLQASGVAEVAIYIVAGVAHLALVDAEEEKKPLLSFEV